ncbi:hypothetical protein [Roseinatronobacter bogoriensis]|uniref:Uncharacterized protein n=2 Tax=Roseinatronobacter bogoriensis TaxID=119542 RepID=A0A2K8K736_9RHOB|nr:hypothetical protein [Rhodobaca bogoriensis]ATX64726.1 hypothetical protein BG454_01830 [Rhodobaca barguzinensis]MBB4209424.1 hypothetical protein [Rhodobaca bogoriensis DSM 18756]TDY66779.1 hypothetical protein EV660_1093 [Rhodobaca bogoriensis DSM 18756]
MKKPMNNPQTGGGEELPQTMNLLEFSRVVMASENITEQEYIDLMRRVLPLHELPKLNREEVRNFAGAACWLYDLSILLSERIEREEHGVANSHLGSPCVPGGHFFVDNILTRAGDEPDFSLLDRLSRGTIQ